MAKSKDIGEDLLSELVFGKKYNRKRAKDSRTHSATQVALYKFSADIRKDERREIQQEINALLAAGVPADDPLIKGLGEEIQDLRQVLKDFQKRIMSEHIELEEPGLLNRKKP